MDGFRNAEAEDDGDLERTGRIGSTFQIPSIGGQRLCSSNLEGHLENLLCSLVSSKPGKPWHTPTIAAITSGSKNSWTRRSSSILTPMRSTIWNCRRSFVPFRCSRSGQHTRCGLEGVPQGFGLARPQPTAMHSKPSFSAKYWGKALMYYLWIKLQYGAEPLLDEYMERDGIASLRAKGYKVDWAKLQPLSALMGSNRMRLLAKSEHQQK